MLTSSNSLVDYTLTYTYTDTSFAVEEKLKDVQLTLFDPGPYDRMGFSGKRVSFKPPYEF